jgi:hypothetical protein
MREGDWVLHGILPQAKFDVEGRVAERSQKKTCFRFGEEAEERKAIVLSSTKQKQRVSTPSSH